MSKPKASQFEAGESEKANASIALAQNNYFDEVYMPKQKEMTEAAFRDEKTLMDTAEGRANADTFIALTENPNRNAVAAVNTEADLASALSGMSLQGTTQGLIGARSDQTNAIKSANKLQADTQTGLSQIAKIENTETLRMAQANLDSSLGVMKGITKLGQGLAYRYGFEQGKGDDTTVT